LSPAGVRQYVTALIHSPLAFLSFASGIFATFAFNLLLAFFQQLVNLSVSFFLHLYPEFPPSVVLYRLQFILCLHFDRADQQLISHVARKNLMYHLFFVTLFLDKSF
jgi:hypothetical protein